MHSLGLTPDNQLGGDSDVVDRRLCCAGVAASVLQLDILDEQLTIWAAILCRRKQRTKWLSAHSTEKIIQSWNLRKGISWWPEITLYIYRDLGGFLGEEVAVVMLLF